MCRIVKGLRTSAEIFDDLAKRGFRIARDDAGRRWEILPPDDATEQEIDDVQAFLAAYMQHIAALYGGKVTITDGSD